MTVSPQKSKPAEGEGVPQSARRCLASTMVDLFEHHHASNILHAVAKLGIKDTRFVSVMKERSVFERQTSTDRPQALDEGERVPPIS